MKKDFYDFTYSQKSIWDEETFFKKSPLNNIAGFLVIDEVVDFKKLKKSILRFIKNNDNCRIRLKQVENTSTTAVQYFDPFYEQDIEVIDVPDVSAVRDLVTTLVNIPFSLFDSYLFEFKIFRFPNNHGGFLINAHHLVFDAWSSGILIKQIMDSYQDLIDSSPVFSYVDYIESEKAYVKSNRFVKDKQFWDDAFKVIPTPVSLPASIKNYDSDLSSFSKRRSFRLSKRSLARINSFCKERGLSLFAFFMSVYSIYLARINNVTNFAIGTPVLNRSNFQEKNTSGLFISTIPFCVSLDWGSSFDDFCRYVSTQTISSFRHQKYPYKLLLEDVRKNNSDVTGLYNVLFSYQNARATNTSSLKYSSEWVSPSAIFNDLQIHVHDINDSDCLIFSYDYRITKYNEKSIVETHNRIMEIVNQVIDNSAVRLCDLEVVTKAEKSSLLSMFSDNKKYFQKGKSIQYFIEKQVERSPDKVAVKANGVSLTYRELNEKANSLAYYLRELGVVPNSFVGILQKRSVELFVSILAVLKAGGAYLPLDFNYPKDRISYMLENSGAKIVLSESSLLDIVPDGISKVIVDFSDDSIFGKNIGNLECVNKGSDVCYIIYTSGSTGNPKGVMLKHQNINNFIFGMCDRINFSKGKSIVSVTTVCFDIFVLESLLPLQNGLTVVLANEEEQNSQVLLNRLCLENKVNIIQTTPSRMKKLIAEPEYCDYFRYITDILVGGEPFPATLLASLKRATHTNNTNIYNVYGPTETAVWSTVKNLSNTNVINIGKPISNTSVYVLDQATHRLLPKGMVGNLFIGGSGVCAGYHGRDDLNESLFIRNRYNSREVIYNTNDLARLTSSNEIVHFGRADFQVKIRGYRIEIGEIENRVLEYPDVLETTVVAQNSNFLICYYVAKKDIIISELVSFLLEDLPNYMIPVYFVKLDMLPLTPNGKVDRKALPKPKIDKNEKIVVASTKTEKLLEENILSVLNNSLSSVDINTPFISLGLDSLSIVQLQSLLLGYNLNLTTQTFYKYPTIKSLARFIDSHDALDSEISFELPAEFMHTDDEVVSKDFDDCLGNVFLTGANGFIGVHVLNELLESTDSTVYCLVRGASLDFSKKRLFASFKFYFDKDLECEYPDRFVVINGDIAASGLGLSNEDCELLRENVSTVIHTAAIVKHYGNFNEFKKININGTKNIVDFSYKSHFRFIHISSISVSGNYLLKEQNRSVDFSENNLYIGQHYSENVYVNSKLESENIVYGYMKKGLRGKVLRVGILSGRRRDGLFQENISANAFYGRIKSFVNIGAISKSLLSQRIEFTPVDDCARAIVLLSKTSELDNKIFHLYNHNLVGLRMVIGALRDCGFGIEVLDDEAFRDRILAYSKSMNDSISAIINDFNTSNLSLDYNFTVNIKSDFSQRALKSLGFSWKRLGGNYLRLIIEYMKNVNFI